VADLAPLRDTFRRFHELGGTVVDTAPSYGDAEAIMGRIMGELNIRRDLFVCTKVGVDNPGQGRAQIAKSFENLRTDRIDLIAVHNLRDITNQLAYLRELKQGGRIRHVGATTSFDRQYEAFEAMMRRETLDAIQIDTRSTTARAEASSPDAERGWRVHQPPLRAPQRVPREQASRCRVGASST